MSIIKHKKLMLSMMAAMTLCVSSQGFCRQQDGLQQNEFTQEIISGDLVKIPKYDFYWKIVKNGRSYQEGHAVNYLSKNNTVFKTQQLKRNSETFVKGIKVIKGKDGKVVQRIPLRGEKITGNVLLLASKNNKVYWGISGGIETFKNHVHKFEKHGVLAIKESAKINLFKSKKTGDKYTLEVDVKKA